MSAAVTPSRWWRHAEIAVVVAVVAILALLVLPLPPLLLDLALATSFAAALVVLLVSLYTTDPLEFSTFPTLLLLMTLYRLALNISSTRLILGAGQAGRIIEAFGNFVIGGNYAVGVVIFLILVAINFIVITKGAGRVAEVAARFTLDAMPGRQMSIDADLSAGLIDDTEARRRREQISREADFYGAMDGAGKFVRGDAVAGLLITGINIVGGIFIGVVQRGMPISKALSHYTVLTVGDGLVTQIPALIVSTAAGIIVTHSAGGTHVGTALASQMTGKPKALWITAGALGALALAPGLPMLPFLALGGMAAAGARAAQLREKQRAQQAQVTPAAAGKLAAGADARPQNDSPVHDLLQIDPVELEVGYALIPLIDEREGGDLMERIRLLRKQAALDVGVLIPPIRIRDDVRLSPNEYVIRLRGSEIARAEVLPRLVLALDTGAVLHEVAGIPTKDPSFGMPAVWVQPAQRLDAESAGYVVVDASTVVATHLMETLKTNAAELLGRQDVQEMVDTLKQTYPALVEEVVPAKVSLGVLHRVLQRLLRERVPIRDLVTILEAIADAAELTKDPEALTEHVRRALGKAIAEQFADDSGTIHVLNVGPRLEAALMGFFSPRSARTENALAMDPDQLTALLRRLDLLARNHSADGRPVPLLTPPALRVGVRRLIEPVLPTIPVLSLAELPPQVNLQAVATWEVPNAA
ncbi:MAG TPA: flagellar biosynthesis protein FlhA [Longimicrobiales bacterium]|nr:flagellar biosynthesis protein FlhA [Longimicrobiales bacterium]